MRRIGVRILAAVRSIERGAGGVAADRGGVCFIIRSSANIISVKGFAGADRHKSQVGACAVIRTVGVGFNVEEVACG